MFCNVFVSSNNLCLNLSLFCLRLIQPHWLSLLSVCGISFSIFFFLGFTFNLSVTDLQAAYNWIIIFTHSAFLPFNRSVNSFTFNMITDKVGFSLPSCGLLSMSCVFSIPPYFHAFCCIFIVCHFYFLVVSLTIYSCYYFTIYFLVVSLKIIINNLIYSSLVLINTNLISVLYKKLVPVQACSLFLSLYCYSHTYFVLLCDHQQRFVTF